MINLNTDRGFITVETWEEIMGLPGFEIGVDPTSVDLTEVLGSYQFKDPIACGLSTCRQPHGKGYVVKTADGRLTNIGNVCGKTYFSVEFESMRRTFDRDILAHQRRERLREFKTQAPIHLETVAVLRLEGLGANRIVKMISVLTNPGRGVPDPVVDKIRELRLARSNQITKQRVATKEEHADAEAIARKKLPKPLYIDEPVGTLAGISATYEENDLRQLLVIDLESNLRTLSECDPDNTPTRDMARHVKWIAELDEKLERAKTIVDAGRRLLDVENLSVLGEIIERPDERQRWQRFLEELPKRLGVAA